MSYICPYCEEDLDDWFSNQGLSPYSSRFKCPKCEGNIETDYEEMWDGEEEYNYYSLIKAEVLE